METNTDLITTSPDENGINDNFSNNPKKLNELLQLLYIIKIDFEKHIHNNNTDLDYRPLTKTRRKKFDKKGSTFTTKKFMTGRKLKA